MAAEAEAAREARAKVIAADGEMRASKALREASQIIEQSPAALQLRYLQVGQLSSAQLSSAQLCSVVRYLLPSFIDNVSDRFFINIPESNSKYHLNIQILKYFQYFQYITGLHLPRSRQKISLKSNLYF